MNKVRNHAHITVSGVNIRQEEKALLYDDEVRSAQTKNPNKWREKLSTATHRRGMVTSHLIRNVFATLEVAGRNSHSRRRDTRQYARLRNETGGKQIS